MAKMLFNGSFSFAGPCLIPFDKLIELDQIIHTECEKMHDNNMRQIESIVNEQSSSNPTIDKDKEKNRLIQSHQFKEKCLLSVICKSGNILSANSFGDAAKEQSMISELPIGFYWNIEYADFKAEISLNKHSSNDFSVHITPEDHLFTKDLLFVLKHWSNGIKPNFALHLWSSIHNFIWLIFGGITLILSSVILPISEMTNSLSMKNTATTIVENGIDNSEINQSIELLLRKEFEIYPQITSINRYAFILILCKIFIISLLATILLSFIPKTYFSLGKGTILVSRWKKWIKLIFVTIPTIIILPIIVDNVIRLINYLI